MGEDSRIHVGRLGEEHGRGADLKALAPEQRARFEKLIREEFVPDVDANQW
jgi:hypothetical protein